MIPQLVLQTRVIILMHTCEEVLTTNTARLVAKALANSEVRIHGRRDERMSLRLGWFSRGSPRFCFTPVREPLN